MDAHPTLYIKRGCPWCREALEFFRDRNVDLVVKDVLVDREAMRRMQEISGQSRTPTLEFDGFICADFDTGELTAALDRHPDVRKRLFAKDGQAG